MAANNNLVEFFLEQQQVGICIDDAKLFNRLEISLKHYDNYNLINSVLIEEWLNYCSTHNCSLSLGLLLQHFEKFTEEFRVADISISIDKLLEFENTPSLLNLLSVIKATNNIFYSSNQGFEIARKHGEKVISNDELIKFILVNKFTGFTRALLYLYVEFDNIDMLQKVVSDYRLQNDDLRSACILTAQKYLATGESENFVDYFLKQQVSIYFREACNKYNNPFVLLQQKKYAEAREQLQRAAKLRLNLKAAGNICEYNDAIRVINSMSKEDLRLIAVDFYQAYGYHDAILQRFAFLNCLEDFKSFIAEAKIDKNNLRYIYKWCLDNYRVDKDNYRPFVEYLRDYGVELNPDTYLYRQAHFSFPEPEPYRIKDKLLLPLVNYYKSTKLHLQYCIRYNRLDLLQQYGFDKRLKELSEHVSQAVYYILNNNYDEKILELLIESGFKVYLDEKAFKKEKFMMQDDNGKLIKPEINKSYLFTAIEQGKGKLVRILLQAGYKIDNDLIRCLPFIKITDEVNTILSNYRDLNSRQDHERDQSCRVM